jgi:hypothetical protein
MRVSSLPFETLEVAMRLARFAVAALCCAVWVSLASAASAQMVGSPPVGNFPGLQFNPFGNSGFAPGMNGMNGVSPQQFNTMMGMRMMQGMGGFHGVQTGVANPFMNGGYGSQPELYYDGPSSTMGSGNSKHGGKAKSNSHAKRDAARAQRAEEKRMAAAAKAKPKGEKVAKKSRKAKDQQ